jgi:hypothetical protein
VTVVGHTNLITDVDELIELAGTFLRPWVESHRDHFIRIQTEKATGGRLVSPVRTVP